MALGVSVLYSIVADFMAVGDSRGCFQLPCLSSTAEKGFCQGLAAPAVPAALTGSLPCCIAQSVCSVIIPQIKQDSSLAIAVFATFGFFHSQAPYGNISAASVRLPGRHRRSQQRDFLAAVSSGHGIYTRQCPCHMTGLLQLRAAAHGHFPP